LDVARATVRNIEYYLSQHRKSFSQHPRASPPETTADRSLHPNRVAQRPSDASAQNERPGASSADIFLPKQISRTNASLHNIFL
jgi:hypothetical protein